MGCQGGDIYVFMQSSFLNTKTEQQKCSPPTPFLDAFSRVDEGPYYWWITTFSFLQPTGKLEGGSEVPVSNLCVPFRENTHPAIPDSQNLRTGYRT